MRHSNPMRRSSLFKFVLTAIALAPCVGMMPQRALAQNVAKPAATKPQDTQKAAPAATQATDREAVSATIKALLAAFQARDAKAVAALWTETGEFVRDGEGSVQGRAALEKGFAVVFAEKTKPQASIEQGPVRFLSKDVAVNEGTVTIRHAGEGTALTSTYSLLLVREGQTWRIAQFREGIAEETTSLQDLAWLIGDWKSAAGEDAEVVTKYSWDENKKFIQVRFTIKSKDFSRSGFQVMGVDPATKQLRVWTFEAEGGIGQAVWERDGEHWTATSTGTLVDGRTLTAVNVLRRINDDTFTWQSTQRRLDDDGLPDLPPTKVTRVKTK